MGFQILHFQLNPLIVASINFSKGYITKKLIFERISKILAYKLVDQDAYYGSLRLIWNFKNRFIRIF